MELIGTQWTELERLARQEMVALVPLGSMEQHGLHLPFSTDTVIVTELARRVEHHLPNLTLRLPTMWLGHSQHHLAFPGSISLDPRPYADMVKGICQSLVTGGFRRIFLLNGHGGNQVPVPVALRELKSELKGTPGLHIAFASYWWLGQEAISSVRESPLGGVSHAGEMETSIILALHPERVALDRVRRDGETKGSSYITPKDLQRSTKVVMVEDFEEISETGTIGHPDVASADKGEQFLSGIVEALIAFVKDFATWS
jgi:creatinine amidohydrolase